jgi:hypothetical protein
LGGATGVCDRRRLWGGGGSLFPVSWVVFWCAWLVSCGVAEGGCRSGLWVVCLDEGEEGGDGALGEAGREGGAECCLWDVEVGRADSYSPGRCKRDCEGAAVVVGWGR